ncbi:aminoglycoside phosphotransferase family protein [Flindersiella endophytica]
MIEVPQVFAREIVDREGDAGARWIASLPGLVDELLERWGCTAPTGSVMHGRVGIVVPVRRRSDGAAAVLKVSFPHPGNVHEPLAFATWAGRGAVLLYERDDARFAMLLELVSQSTLLDLDDDDEAAAVCGRLTRRLAVPAPLGLPRLSDRADHNERSVRDAFTVLRDHVPRRAVELALGTVRELVREQPELLVHGDLHYKNIVRATREPWLVIDPKGFAGDPASNAIGVLIGAFQRQLPLADVAHVRRRLSLFASAAELERERVVRWAQLHALLHAYRGRRSGSTRGVELAERAATVLA